MKRSRFTEEQDEDDQEEDDQEEEDDVEGRGKAVRGRFMRSEERRREYCCCDATGFCGCGAGIETGLAIERRYRLSGHCEDGRYLASRSVSSFRAPRVRPRYQDCISLQSDRRAIDRAHTCPKKSEGSTQGPAFGLGVALS